MISRIFVLIFLIMLLLPLVAEAQKPGEETLPYWWRCKHPPCDAVIGPGTYIGSQDLGEAGVWGWRTCTDCQRSFLYDRIVPAQSYNPWTGRGTGGVAWRGRFHGGGGGHTRSYLWQEAR